MDIEYFLTQIGCVDLDLDRREIRLVDGRGNFLRLRDMAY